MRSNIPRGTVYYGSSAFLTYEGKRPKKLPAGVYIYETWMDYTGWYTADFCPCFPEDVPTETRVIHLLLNP